LSDDNFGDELHASLQREGVTLPMQRRSLCPTSLALVTVNEQGQPSYRLYREGIADKDTTLEEIVENLPRDLQLFHTGSLAITPSQLPKITALFSLLRERGIGISIDINIRLRASIDQKKYLDGVRSLLAYADIVKASDEDIDAFALNKDLRRAAQQLHTEMQGGLLILTEGTGGAILYGAPDDSTPIESSAYPVATVSDTVGAGDTFHSAFLATLYRTNMLSKALGAISTPVLAQALDFACAAAAINVSRAGCSPPTFHEVTRFMTATMR